MNREKENNELVYYLETSNIMLRGEKNSSSLYRASLKTSFSTTNSGNKSVFFWRRPVYFQPTNPKYLTLGPVF